MKSFLLKILLIIVAISAAEISYAQKHGFYKETSFVKSYDQSELGGSFFVFDIAEDANGSMLLATSNGLYVMNSDRLSLFKTNSKSSITRLAIDKDHRIFVVGYLDLGYFEAQANGSLKFFPICESSEFLQEKFSDIVIVENAVYFIGSNNIFVYDYKNVRKVEVPNILRVYKLGDRVFVYTSDGQLSVFDGHFTRNIFDLKKIGISISDVHFLSFNDEHLHITDNSDIFRIETKKIDSGKKLELSDFEPMSYEQTSQHEVIVSDITYDKVLNKVAISTNRGIRIYNNNGKFLQTVNFLSGLPYDDVKRLYFDSRHNLWAIMTRSIAKIELNTPTVYYSNRQGLGGAVSCFASFGGNLYCGSFDCLNCAPIDTKNNSSTSFKHVVYDKTFKDNTCWALKNIDGNLLACTGDGLYQVEGLNAKRILDTKKLYDIEKSDFYPDKLFLSCINGLYIVGYKNSNGKISFSDLHHVDGLDFPIWFIDFDKNGSLWLNSGYDGIYYVVPKDKNLTRYSIVNLGQNIGFSESPHLQFYLEDGFFDIFCDGSHFSAKLPDNPDFMANQLVFRYDSLLDLSKYVVKENFCLDNSGDVFIHYDDNFIIAYKQTDNSYRIDTLIFKRPINTVYGLEKQDSLLFLATDIGLLKHNLKSKPSERPERYPFNTLICSVEVNDSSVFDGVKYFDGSENRSYSRNANDPDVFGWNIYSLKFFYSTTSFDNQEQVTYSYILEGYDDDWSDFTLDSQHDFGQLRPGTYTFKVRAKNCAGVVSDVSVYNFKIESPLFLRWWSILLYVLIVLSLIYYFVRIKTRRLHKENIKLERIASERYYEISRQNEQLRLLSLVASTTKNSIIILDSKGNFEYANSSFNAIYGYTFEEYKQRFGINYFEAETNSNPEHAYYISQAVETKQSQAFENFHIKPDSQKVWVQVTMDPLFDSKGDLCNWIICESNITLLKAADQESLMQTQALTEAYMDLSERQVQIEFQKQQLMSINQRLETGYKQLNRQNLTIKESLRYAQSIQNSILPSDEQISEFLDFFIIYMPKDIVSGDFYIYEKLSETSFITIVSDCTGHGVPGAFMSIIGHNILTQIIKNQNITDPIEILELLSKKLVEVLKQDVEQNSDGMDLCICKFDKNSEGYYDVSYSGTRSSIYIYSRSKNHLSRIRGSQRQIGWGCEFTQLYKFGSHSFKFEKDDFMIMLSDGLIDQCNEQRRRYGSDRFSEFIVMHSDMPMREMGNELVKSLQEFMKGAEQRDDITVFGFTSKF